MFEEIINEEMVTITADEYNELLDERWLLECLRNAGVDNWDGWDFALEEYRKDEP